MFHTEPIHVVIVDDSAVFRKFLTNLLETSENIKVTGTATNGLEAIDIIQRLKPQVVLMDINMPGFDGFEATARIMSLSPVPVIILSGEYTPAEVAKTFKALEVGAVDILPKPPGIGSPEYTNELLKLILRIRLMSEVKVVRRNYPLSPLSLYTTRVSESTNLSSSSQSQKRKPKIIGIGASAGGPIAIQQILLGLDSNFSIPIVIVQHIDSVFAEGFAQFLEMTTHRKMTIATYGMELKPGMIVLPPGDVHLGFTGTGVVEISKSPPDRGLRPSVNYLFTSIAESYGSESVGIILSGMGADGVKGLSLMKEKGALTIAQDAESSMIHGMPGEAIKSGAAQHVYSIKQIVDYLNETNRLTLLI